MLPLAIQLGSIVLGRVVAKQITKLFQEQEVYKMLDLFLLYWFQKQLIQTINKNKKKGDEVLCYQQQFKQEVLQQEK